MTDEATDYAIAILDRLKSLTSDPEILKDIAAHRQVLTALAGGRADAT